MTPEGDRSLASPSEGPSPGQPRGDGPGQQLVSVVLPSEPGSVATARQAVVDALRSLGVGGEEQLLADAALVASELTSNALRFGDGPVELSVTLVEGLVEIALSDNSPMLPVLRRPDPDDLSGRGLPILAALSVEWGYETRGERKRVWGRLAPVTAPQDGC